MSTKMTLEMVSATETELQRLSDNLNEPRIVPFRQMLTYHMGWTGDGSGPESTGKRIRPLLVLLTCTACGGNWKDALPAAAAVEFIHNFSLVHDDIQDNSPIRRGRPSVWANWGVPMAINVGDALFALSNLSILNLMESYPAEMVNRVAYILHKTCLTLTEGQFLDMTYESTDNLKVEDYWPMVTGKTAALLSASCQLGSILGEADEATIEAYQTFGHYLGLAFQVQDDILGIWGDEALTGKSSASDLVEGKRSLPVIFGLEKCAQFSSLWVDGRVKPQDVEAAARLLASEGAYEFAHETARQMTDMAINTLRGADPQGEAGEALYNLADHLLHRNS